MLKRQRYQNWLIPLAVLAAVRIAAAAEEAAKAPPDMLYLADGDFFTGTLEDSETPDVVRWQTTGIVRPFEFPTAAIRAVYFPPLPQHVAAEADYCFELSNGDLLFGSLTGLTAETLEINSPRFGQLHIERSQVRRISPWQGSTAWAYSGPSGLSEWEHEPKDAWQEEAGHLLTYKAGASLRKNVNIPRQASIELALSWEGAPNFVFGISSVSSTIMEKAEETVQRVLQQVNRAQAREKQTPDSISLEVWKDMLVVVRESQDDADVASVCDLKSAKKGIHLLLLVDQEKRTLVVCSLDGAKLGEIGFKNENPWSLDWISLRNLRGDVRLEQLVVSQWNGQLPPQIDVDRERVHLATGEIIYGEVARYEPDARRFIVQEGTEERQIDAQQVSNIVMTPAVEPAGTSVRIGCHDGTRLGGQLAKVASGKLYMTRAGVEEALIFPAADVRFLVGVHGESEHLPRTKSIGRLELEGVRSHGTLLDGESDGETSCLVWQPKQSTTASPLQPNVNGRIVYRDPPPPAPVTQQPQPVQRQRGLFGVIAEAFTGPTPDLAVKPRLSGYPHTLFLLAGDRIPCIVDRIDEEGVHFTSSVIESELIPHAQIKALELAPRSVASALAEVKRLRLLTLPRMQKNNPPTHLIASTGGDFLRARLQSLNGQSLAAETRLATKRLPRSHVACIIWLHPAGEEKLASSDASQTASMAQVQAIRADGVRLTFVPREFAADSLIGNSEFLGPCQVDVKLVDRLMIGEAIGDVADEPTYEAWKLQDAVEPKFAQDEAGGAPSSTRLNSALVSKPAPDFRLELLDGGHFQLSGEKGHIVVLDFWASWCADCMRNMPEVAQAVNEFAGEEVKYIAVNMQEDRATIASALERLKLQATVALDIDGATAEKYEVTAIPQIVVVDRAGNVARLFIGTELNFSEQLRQTLQEMIAQKAPAEETSGEP